MAAIGLNSDLTYVNISYDSTVRRFLNYDTLYTSHSNFSLKSDISYVDTSSNSIIRKCF